MTPAGEGNEAVAPARDADLAAQLRKGVVEYCVLALLAREPMYGWQLADTLTRGGLIASIGTLYPLLNRLRSRGLVATFERASDSGPVRKYYRMTDAGRAELVAFSDQWRRFKRTVDPLLEPPRQSDPATATDAPASPAAEAAPNAREATPESRSE